MIKKILIVGYVWPEPNSSAAGSRMLQLIELFIAQGARVVFASAALLSAHRFPLAQLGVEEKSIALNSSSFDDYVKGLQPHMVLFDRFFTEEQFGWRVARAWPAAMRVLNTEDLHSLRGTRQRLLKAQCGDMDQAYQALANMSVQQLQQAMVQEDICLREMAAIFRCDLTIMIAQFEMNLLRQFFSIPGQQLCYCPLLEVEPVSDNHGGFEQRQHFITIGNFRHEPNWDAVLWLKQSLWPALRKALPRAELHVYGAYPPPKATQLHKPCEGFHVKGWVEDGLYVMRHARVCLAPLRFGAGIKGKLLDAMRCGTPSVTTSIGAESMQGNLPWPGAVADCQADFVAASIALYQDASRWEQAHQQGFQVLDDFFAVEDYGQRLWQRLTDTVAHISGHRNANFIGAMLQHHQLASTKYMGQWIETKHKLLAQSLHANCDQSSPS